MNQNRETRTHAAARLTDQAPADASTDRALRLAAREAFAQSGYDGASIRTITAAAGANLGAVTYHFGSKRALYEAVVEDVLGPLADRVVAAATSERAPLDRAGDVVRAFFAYFGSNHDVPRLMLQELANGRELPPVAERNMARMLGALSAMVQAGQADGSMRAGEARLMALAIVSHPLHLHLVRGPLRSFASIDIDDPALRERIVENAVRFVRGGLSAVPNGKIES